jgi:hypothetical protein
MTAVATTLRATQSVTCYKCHGTKRFAHFSGIANGVCFTCGGSGSITVDALTVDERLRGAISCACYTAEIIMEAASRGDSERVDFYAVRLVADLRTLGTAGAREVLAHVAKGMYTDRETDRPIAMPRGTAGILRARIIELGRAA